jgi:type II secretory pathway pseudopilin PulG
MKKLLHNSRGFSLIEMIVYIAVLTFLLGIILNVVVSVAGADRLIKSARNVESSAILALERVTREARGMENIVIASSTLGVHPGRLYMSGENASGLPRNIEFYLSNGQVFMNENGISLGALTSSDATVTNLVFQRFATSTVEGVRAEITIESGTSTHYRAEKFYSSVLLRKDEQN